MTQATPKFGQIRILRLELLIVLFVLIELAFLFVFLVLFEPHPSLSGHSVFSVRASDSSFHSD